MSDAVGSQGVKLQRGTAGSPSSFDDIAEIVSVGGPNPDSEQIDVTHLGSQGAYREFVSSFKDGGQVSLNANFLASHVSGLIADYDSQDQVDFRVVFPLTGGDKTGSFSANVKNYNINAAVGEKISISAVLKISGAVQWD